MSLRSEILVPVLASVFVAGVFRFFGVSNTVKRMMRNQVASEQASTTQAIERAIETKVHQYDAFLGGAQDRVVQQAVLFSELPEVPKGYRHGVLVHLVNGADDRVTMTS